MQGYGQAPVNVQKNHSQNLVYAIGWIELTRRAHQMAVSWWIDKDNLDDTINLCNIVLLQ